MHILHITEHCHTGSIGGTERYLLDLVHGLERLGVHSTIGWLNARFTTLRMNSEGVRVICLPAPSTHLNMASSKFLRVAESLLEIEQPDWLHFHTFGVTEATLAALAKKRGIPYAFTYHSLAWSCRRGTGLLYGKEQCDGKASAWRCSSCLVQGQWGSGPVVGHTITLLSMLAGWAIRPFGWSSIWRQGATYYDSSRFSRYLKEFLEECELVVSCCDWSVPILKRNGARENCIVHCPQGVSNTIVEALRRQHNGHSSLPETMSMNNNSTVLSSDLSHFEKESGALCKRFIIGYVGRVTSLKGVHILAEGFSRMNGDEARLRIIGWEPKYADRLFSEYLKRLVVADSRIELIEKRSLADTLVEYRKLSLLAVPSAFKETGPLTLLEGLAMGLPVFGSNQVGQLDLLRDCGRIVEPNTSDAWCSALTEAFTQWKEGMFNSERKSVRVRTMIEVAKEMTCQYTHAIQYRLSRSRQAKLGK